jgi:hypothetical protein
LDKTKVEGLVDRTKQLAARLATLQTYVDDTAYFTAVVSLGTEMMAQQVCLHC